MFNIGSPELLAILVIALIVVGPRRLPEIGRTVGRALNEFRKVQDEVRDMVRFDLGDEDGTEAPVTAPVPAAPDVGTSPSGDTGPDAPDPSVEDALETTPLPDRADGAAGGVTGRPADSPRAPAE